MATDVRKHTVPAAGDAPRRQAILDLGLSIRDVIPVANTTARGQLISAMTAASVGPSSTNPVFVFRADAPAGCEVEYTTNGTAWSVIRTNDTGWVALTIGSGWTGTYNPSIRRVGQTVYLTGEVYGGASGSVAALIPAGLRPLRRFAVRVGRGSASAANEEFTLSVPTTLDSIYIAGSIPTSPGGVSLGGVSWVID